MKKFIFYKKNLKKGLHFLSCYGKYIDIPTEGRLAQLVEQRIEVPCVRGSIP